MRDINLFHHGISPSNSGITNREAWQALVDQAPVGARFVIPSTSAAERVSLSGTVVFRRGDSVVGLGGLAYLAQTSWGAPILDGHLGGLTVESVEAVCLAAKAADTAQYRSTNRANSTVVAWLGGGRNRLRRITGKGFTSVGRATNYDAVTQTEAGFAVGDVFEDIESDGCDWGINCAGLDGATFRRFRGSYALRPGSNDPSHILYIAGGATRQSRNITVEDIQAEHGYVGHALSLKDIDGLMLPKVLVRNCDGLFNYTGLKNANIADLSGIADRGQDGNGTIYGFGSGTNDNIVAKRVTIDVADGHVQIVRIARLDGSNSEWKDLRATINRTVDNSANDVLVAGSKNTLRRFRVNNLGPYGQHWIGFAAGSDGNRIVDPEAIGARSVVNASNSTNSLVEYEPRASTVAPGGLSKVVVTIASATLRPRYTVEFRTTAGGETLRGDCTFFTVMRIAVTGAGNVMINSPTGKGEGMEISYEIVNTLTTPMGALAFTNAHALREPAVAPAAGSVATYRFRYDYAANKWYEIGRSVKPA